MHYACACSSLCLLLLLLQLHSFDCRWVVLYLNFWFLLAVGFVYENKLLLLLLSLLLYTFNLYDVEKIKPKTTKWHRQEMYYTFCITFCCRTHIYTHTHMHTYMHTCICSYLHTLKLTNCLLLCKCSQVHFIVNFSHQGNLIHTHTHAQIIHTYTQTNVHLL